MEEVLFYAERKQVKPFGASRQTDLLVKRYKGSLFAVRGRVQQLMR
ncbi:hypothetical protein ADIAL_0549 [Alkalibacterium sp. AK22]|nr:hypothetical protein ADIAL_0549 [Alkalibacterium sp. AK22]